MVRKGVATSRRLTRTAVAVAFVLSGPNLQASEPRPVAIVHGILVDGRGGPPLPDTTLLIRGGMIEAVGSGGRVPVPRNSQVIDATNKTMMPGLADLHVHMQGGWDGNSVDLLGYQRYLNALLYAGVTTVLDTGNFQPWVLQLRQEAASGRLVAPRIYCVGAFIDGLDAAWPDQSNPFLPFPRKLSTSRLIPCRLRWDK